MTEQSNNQTKPWVLGPDSPGPNLAPVTIATSVLCLIVTTLAIIFRSLTKLIALRSIHLDDCLAIFAWVCFVGFTGYILSAIPHGVGSHTSQVTVDGWSYITQVIFVLEILWCPLMLATRLSVCIQLSRIFCGMKKGKLYWTFRAIMVINTILFTASFFMAIFSCTPISAQWTLGAEKSCPLDEKWVGLASALWNIVSDILTFVLPLAAVWRLKLPVRRRLGIAGIFASALLAPISSICRLYSAIQYAAQPDIMYSIMQLGLWSLAEVTIYIMCGFMPLIPKFIQMIRGRARRFNYNPNINSMHRTMDTRIKRTSPTRSQDRWGNDDEMTTHLTRLDQPDQIVRQSRRDPSLPPSEEDRSRSKSRHSFMGSLSEIASETRGTRIVKTVKIETHYETTESLEAMRIENWT